MLDFHQHDPDAPDNAPDVESVPDFDAIAPWYQRLLDLAEDLLSGTVSTDIRSWEDGEFDVRVWHKYESPNENAFRREVLWYHRREDTIYAGVIETDRETDEETLLLKTAIDPGGIGQDAEKIRDRVGED